MPVVDLAVSRVRELNKALHQLPRNTNETHWTVQNPAGQHSIAVGIDALIEVLIEGHVGYYCAGMNKDAQVTDQWQCRRGPCRKHDVRCGPAVRATPARLPARPAAAGFL